MRFIEWLRDLWNAWVPSDETLEAAPENEAAIRQRMNQLEILRVQARKRVAELHTTQSPIHRRSA